MKKAAIFGGAIFQGPRQGSFFAGRGDASDIRCYVGETALREEHYPYT